MAQVNTAQNLIHGGGQLVVVTDAAANDSDKTLTVTTGKVWQVLYLNATLVTTADAGNRQMQVLVADAATNEVYRMNAADVQAASTTNYYHYSPQVHTAAETISTFHTIPLLASVLPSGATIRVYDSAAIAAAADDLTITALVIEYDGR